MNRFRSKTGSRLNCQSSERLELPSMSPVDQNYHFQDGSLTVHERPYIKCAAMRPGAGSPGSSQVLFLQWACVSSYPVYGLEMIIK